MNEETDRFETETGVQTSNIIGYLASGGVLVLLSLFGLYFSVWMFLFLAGCSVIAVAFLALFQTRIKWIIVFEGDRMYTRNTMNSAAMYNAYDCGVIRMSQIKLKLTNKKKDRGYLGIPGTVYKYGNIKNFTAMKEYLEAHLQP
ncbi:MAG: hypothetical protein J5879_08995 [Clostridia bacterium]|nr:hypothetical protein [Clostridia bacterium]